MSEDVYVLKEKADNDALDDLNNKENVYPERIGYAINDSYTDHLALDIIEDWIAALRSGKEIVNPLSPQEEFEKWYRKMPDTISDPAPTCRYQPKTVVKALINIIAKEHPDVKDWLGDQDE